MTINDLKKWIDILPIEYGECELVFRDIKPCDSENWLGADIPISACGIDTGTKEAYFCDEKSYQVIQNT